MMGERCGGHRRRAPKASLLIMATVVLALVGRNLVEVEVVESNELQSPLERYLRPDTKARLDLDAGEVRAEAAWICKQFPSLKVRVVMVGMPVFARHAYDVAGYPTPDGKPLNGAKIAGALGPGASEVYVFGSAIGIEAEVVAHEMGHAFWYRLASSGDRAWYVKVRRLHGRQDAFASECFAEDFRLSFGSRYARRTGHRYLGSGPAAEFAGRFGPSDSPPPIRYTLNPDGGISVVVEERPLAFPDLLPWREGEIVWVPVRPVAEALGWDVQYDPPTGWASLRRGDRQIQFRPGHGPVLVDGTDVCDVQFVLTNGRIAMPIDHIARLMGYPAGQRPLPSLPTGDLSQKVPHCCC